MPTHKSAEKRVRADKKRNTRNVSAKAALKTLRTKVLKAKTKEEAVEPLKEAISNFHKAASKGIIHKNTAARKISRLTKNINKLS
ncbi:30S ribosomal protein S20 [Candidatus Poribacteria bacterium]|nr:30S ribosomal protein S20 [Candidatus Poribacteria bacterium]